MPNSISIDTLRANESDVLSRWTETVNKVEDKFRLAKENADYIGTITDYLEVVADIHTHAQFHV